MKKTIRNISIFVFPFLLMIIINEIIRPSIKGKPNLFHGQTAMNTGMAIIDRCSWKCHNNTNYCKEHHVKLLGVYLTYTNILYEAVIKVLKSSDYVFMNIIFLVLFIPFMIWYFLVKSLKIQDEINKIKKR